MNTQALVAAELAVSDKQDKYAWFGCMTATCLFPLRLRIHKFKALQLNSFSSASVRDWLRFRVKV